MTTARRKPKKVIIRRASSSPRRPKPSPMMMALPDRADAEVSDSLSLEEVARKLKRKASPESREFGRRRLKPEIKLRVERSHGALREALGLVHCVVASLRGRPEPDWAKHLAALGCKPESREDTEQALVAKFWPIPKAPGPGRKNAQGRLYEYAKALQWASRNEFGPTEFAARLAQRGESLDKWADFERAARRREDEAAGEEDGPKGRTPRGTKVRAKQTCGPPQGKNELDGDVNEPVSGSAPFVFVPTAMIKKVSDASRIVILADRKKVCGFTARYCIPITPGMKISTAALKRLKSFAQPKGNAPL